MLIKIKCPDCGVSREIERYITWRENYTGCCRRCGVLRLHLKKKTRSLESRPITKRTDGYLEVSLPREHWCIPMSNRNGQAILVHRLVMAEHLGRLLTFKEIVHHKNGNRSDNHIENLQLTTHERHGLTYTDGYLQGLQDGINQRNGVPL